MGLNVNPQSETKIFDWNAQMIDNALMYEKKYVLKIYCFCLKN